MTKVGQHLAWFGFDLTWVAVVCLLRDNRAPQSGLRYSQSPYYTILYHTVLYQVIIHTTIMLCHTPVYISLSLFCAHYCTNYMTDKTQATNDPLTIRHAPTRNPGQTDHIISTIYRSSSTVKSKKTEQKSSLVKPRTPCHHYRCRHRRRRHRCRCRQSNPRLALQTFFPLYTDRHPSLSLDSALLPVHRCP